MHRRWLLSIAAPTLALGMLTMRGVAQQQPPADGGGTGATTMPTPPMQDPRGGPGNDDPDRPLRGPDGNLMGPGGGPRGPFGGGFGDHGRGGPGGGPGGMERRMPSMDVMRGYYELVDRYTRLSSDADAAGVNAVITANDLIRTSSKNSDAAIAYFTKLLDEVPRPAVKRAIRLQLIDLYKAAGKTDQAIEQLEILMKAPIEK